MTPYRGQRFWVVSDCFSIADGDIQRFLLAAELSTAIKINQVLNSVTIVKIRITLINVFLKRTLEKIRLENVLTEHT